ncbi:hypothetical protein [Chitinophaga silvatica]|nr:hypothetical protein [Chitinophaga silvatica]
MNIRKYYYGLVLILALISTTVNAQNKVSFQQAVGIGYFTAHQYNGFNFGEYEARLNYAFSSTSSISLNCRLGIGYGRNEYNSNAKDSFDIYEIRFLPVGLSASFKGLFSYNFGNAATRRAYKKLGGAIGFGYSAYGGSRSIDDWSQEVDPEGICIDGKFNFPIGNTSWTFNANYTFKTYSYSEKSSDINGIFSCSILYNINTPIHPKMKKRHRL